MNIKNINENSFDHSDLNVGNSEEYIKSRKMMCSHENVLNISYINDQHKMFINSFIPTFVKSNERVKIMQEKYCK